jgi:hypothetical protein
MIEDGKNVAAPFDATVRHRAAGHRWPRMGQRYAEQLPEEMQGK